MVAASGHRDVVKAQAMVFVAVIVSVRVVDRAAFPVPAVVDLAHVTHVALATAVVARATADLAVSTAVAAVKDPAVVSTAAADLGAAVLVAAAAEDIEAGRRLDAAASKITHTEKTNSHFLYLCSISAVQLF